MTAPLNKKDPLTILQSRFSRYKTVITFSLHNIQTPDAPGLTASGLTIADALLLMKDLLDRGMLSVMKGLETCEEAAEKEE